MKVGIIGCGAIARKRAAALVAAGDELVATYDVEARRAHRLAAEFMCAALLDPEKLVAGVDAVIVCTPHKHLATMAKLAIEAGKPVLLEKPGACAASHLRELAELAGAKGVPVHVGYSLRHHPGARWLVEVKRERPMVVRGFYGHGARPGYEKEWRSRDGGGVFLDLMTHLLDLSGMVLGHLACIEAMCSRWLRWGSEVEDNAVVIAQGLGNAFATLQTSATWWRNAFRFEVATERGIIVWEGIGGSYGPETITHYLGSPGERGQATRVEFNEAEGIPWEHEWSLFCAKATGRVTDTNLDDAIRVLDLLEMRASRGAAAF